MVADGFTITRAIQSRSWPAASANLEYAAVWGTRCRGQPTTSRGSRMTSRSDGSAHSSNQQAALTGIPVRLAENSGIAFQGCIVLGMGFVLDPAEAQEWIAADPRNAEVLFPYLNGEDLNSRPDASASRWVIDFNDRCREEAGSDFALPFARIVEQRADLSERQEAEGRARCVHDGGSSAEHVRRLREAISELSEVLVIARVSKTVMPLRVPTGQVSSEASSCSPLTSYSVQAVLSSNLHQLWAITYGSTLRDDPRYTPSDVFETFPRPEPPIASEQVGDARRGAPRDHASPRPRPDRSSTTSSTTPILATSEITESARIDAHARRARRGDLGRLRLV